jgi:AbrB family looped-hinge helix DNA binding protein
VTIELIAVGNIVGVGLYVGESGEIDQRGRVTIPKDIRERAGFRTGDRVRLSAEKDTVTIERVVSLETFIAELRGCITVESDLNPLRLKEIWRTAP